MLFHERYEKVLKELFENIPYRYNSDLLHVMQEYSEPSEIHPYRYDYGITYRTDAFKEACNKFNRKMGTNYHVGTRHNVFEPDKQDEDSLNIQPIYYLFSIIELQFKELSTDEANAFADAINNLFKDIELPWLLSDGKLIKIDAKQFECDLKLKVIESLKELKDAEPKFQSAYTELTDAIEYLDKGDYQSAINNAGKSYESILKVILGVDKGNANELTQKYKDTFLSVPATMPIGGFESQVMKALPFIRNNSGADHGAGAKAVVISKPMAKLAVNLAAALDTYLIEEYAERIAKTEE